MLVWFLLANFLQTLLGGTRSENLTTNMRRGDPQSHACCFRAGRTHGYHWRSRATTTERQHVFNVHHNRSGDS